MIDFIRKRIDQHFPKVNPLIGHGMATSDLQGALRDVEGIYRSAFRGLDPVEFVGMRRLRPDEAFEHACARRPSVAAFDLAPKDLFAVATTVKVAGETLPERIILLPFARPGNMFNVNGSHYRFSPVHADRVISVDQEGVFVRLYRAKLRFARFPWYYRTDDSDRREAVQVVYSTVYNDPNAAKNGKKTRRGAAVKTTMGHYLFAKFGPVATFQNYAGFTPIIAENLTKACLPEGDWVICRSGREDAKAPSAFPTPAICIAVPRAHYTQQTKYLVAAFFYGIDSFAGRTQLNDYLDERMWALTLGAAIWSLDESYTKLISNVMSHLGSLDEYMDQQVNHKLKLSGYHCDTVYDLFMLVLSQMDQWLILGDQEGNSYHGKELGVNYHVLYDVMAQAFRLGFRFNSARRDMPERLTAQRANAWMMGMLRPGVIFNVTKPTHGEVTGFSFPGDCMLCLATREMVPQANSGHARQGVSRSEGLHASAAEVGNLYMMTKAAPDGASQLNPFLQRDATGLIAPSERLAPLLRKVAQELVVLGHEEASGIRPVNVQLFDDLDGSEGEED